MTVIETPCFIRTFALTKEGYSIFAHENSVSLCVFTTWSLSSFIGCSSDNIVQAVIIIEIACILWQNHVLNVVFTLKLAL